VVTVSEFAISRMRYLAALLRVTMPKFTTSILFFIKQSNIDEHHKIKPISITSYNVPSNINRLLSVLVLQYIGKLFSVT